MLAQGRRLLGDWKTPCPNWCNILASDGYSAVAKRQHRARRMEKCPMIHKSYRAGFNNYLGRFIGLSIKGSSRQNRLFGLVRPSCQFLRVPMLTPSFTANASWESLVFIRYSFSNSASDWGLFWQGYESTLMALITRWQKGFRNHPFRQRLQWFYEFPKTRQTRFSSDKILTNRIWV